MKFLYTTSEAMEALGVRTTKLYREINEGRLVAVKNGPRTFITGASIERRIAQMERLVTPTMKAREGGTTDESMPYGLMTAATRAAKHALAKGDTGTHANRRRRKERS